MCRPISDLKQIVCALALLCLPGWLVAQPKTYTVTELTTPPGGYVVGGNNIGEYVGATLNTPSSAILWKNPASPTTLSPLGGSGGTALANAINDAGQAVGASGVDGTHTHATLWQGNSVQDLGIPPGDQYSQATAINSAGVVVGVGVSATAVDIEGYPLAHALLFGAGTISDLGTPGNDSVANGINSAGQIVGWSNLPASNTIHAMLWTGTVPTDLGTLGGPNSSAMAINDSGIIVGDADLPGAGAFTPLAHATMWKDGVLTDLGVLSGNVSVANAINSNGDVVGISTTSSNSSSPQHAVLWSKGQIIDLNSVLPAALQAAVVLIYGQAIADDGSIIAEGQTAGATDSCCSRVFLLTPVAPLTISCPSSTAQTAAAYSSAAIASGGVPPYTYSTSGTLPPGLTLTSRSGAITGTPTAAGTFNFTVQATDSSSGVATAATRACTIAVIPRPDFSLETSPGSLNLAPRSIGRVLISASASNGFAGAVTLSVSRAPAGASLSLRPSSISGTQISTLTINTGSAAAGTYSIMIMGSTGSLTHSTNVPLTIAANSTLTVSPTSLLFNRVHHYAVKFKQIEITNSGTTPASIEQPQVRGSEAARDSFVPISLCGHTLEPSHSCRVVVVFIAEQLGRLSATLEIPTKTQKPLLVPLNAEVIPLRQ